MHFFIMLIYLDLILFFLFLLIPGLVLSLGWSTEKSKIYKGIYFISTDHINLTKHASLMLCAPTDDVFALQMRITILRVNTEGAILQCSPIITRNVGDKHFYYICQLYLATTYQY